MRDPFFAVWIGARCMGAESPAELTLVGLSGVPSIARRDLGSFWNQILGSTA